MFLNIPSNRDNGLFIFPGTKTAGTNEWQSWTIPSSASYISMIAIGAGGNGGLGRNALSGTGKGGGGGGGSGGISKAIFKASVLPSTLYFNLTSSETTISLEPNSGNSLFVKILYALAGGNGGSSTTTAGGTAGTAATNASASPAPFLASALAYHTVGGMAGAAGGAAGATGTSVQFMPSASYGLHGGAGGGGTSTTPTFFAGGSCASTADYLIGVTAGAPSGATGNGSDGGHGAWYWKPHLVGLGGGGGGAGQSSPGSGGNGAYGCGGGGGGSNGLANPNAGGIGGPGLIIIKCF